MCIYLIFSCLRTITKRSKSYSLIGHSISKVVGVSKKILGDYFIVYACFLIFWPFWGINIICGHIRTVVKRSKFCSLIHHDIWSHWCKLKFLWGIICIFLCVILDFLVILSIYVIFGHFQAIMKITKVLFSYFSRYFNFIVTSWNVFEAFFVLFKCVSCYFGHFGKFTLYLAIFR